MADWLLSARLVQGVLTVKNGLRAAIVGWSGRWPGAGRVARRLTGLQRLLVAYYSVYVLWYFVSGATGRLRTFVSDAAYLPLGAAGLVLSLRAAYRSRRARDRAVWLLIALALLLRLWGDGAWWWLEAVRQSSPFPSVADIGYFSYYPVLTVALAAVPVRRQSRRASAGNLLDVLAMVGGAFMIVWYLVLGSALQDGVDSLEQALNVAYPLWDLLLMLAGGRVLLRGTDPRWTAPARWLIVGALLFVVADVGFGYLSGLDGFTGGGWLDLPWIGALLCFALAATSRPRVGVTRDGELARHAHLLPVLAVVASYVVVAKVGWQLPLFPVGGVLLIDLAITVAVLGRQLVAVAEHRDLAARYREAAVTDALTGAASRSHFLQQADEVLARQGSERCALVMIDVDHFKTVNDAHGHLAGDAALRAVAAHLGASTREDDLLARFGGDEFVALLIDVTVEQAATVVARMTDVTELHAAGQQLSLSVGWTCQAGTLTELLGRADTALYAAKTAGRGRAVALHDLIATRGAELPAGSARGTPPDAADVASGLAEPAGMAGLAGAAGLTGLVLPGLAVARGTRQSDLNRAAGVADCPRPAPPGAALARRARELRAAIVQDQLTLHYQPKIEVAGGTVCGVEALVRWCHPEQGLRYPDSFLPEIEVAGLMPALTDRVLAMALDQQVAWRRDGMLPLTVAVNLSASSLTDSALPARVGAALTTRGLPGSGLLLEITEQCLIQDRAGAGQVLAGLREQGVRISLDDFGTGYSSLAYLRDLPVDELKLDRAFIAPLIDDARAAALVHSTIELSHALGLPMVAEGVEDSATCEQLARYGCDMLQGYHLARPMPASHLVHWLQERHVTR